MKTTVNITNLDQINRKTNPFKNIFGIALIGSFLVIVFIVGMFLLNDVEQKVRRNTADQLNTILNTTSETLSRWMSQRLLDTRMKVDEIDFKKQVSSLREAVKENDEEEIRDKSSLFQEELESWVSKNNDLGFYVIGQDSINITATNVDEIGKINSLFNKAPQYLEKCFKGEAVIIPPIDSDIPLPETTGLVVYGFSTMFIGVPVSIEEEKKAIFVVRINLAQTISEITQVGQFGQTGETYALDKKGKLLSKSRFEEELRSAGFLRQETITRSTFEIRNPGVDITGAQVPSTARLKQPYTLMAESIMRKESSFNHEGYQGYLGLKVIGAWKWFDEYGIGLATEIREDEALSLYYSIRVIMFIGLAVIVIFALALVLGMIWVRRKSFNALEEINKTLEESVTNRTKELAKSNAQLVDSWERFRKLTHHSHDLNKIVDQDGKIKFESSSVVRVLGVNEGERLDKYFIQFVHDDDVDLVQKKLRQVIECEIPVVHVEYRFKKNDENYVVLESYMQNFLDDPNIEGIIINSRDVTDRRLAEENVSKSEQRFRSVWENSRDGMRITDPDGMVLMVNNMFCILTKHEKGQILGESLSVIYPEELRDSIQDKYIEQFDSGEIVGRHEEEVKLVDNTIVWFSISNSYIHLDDGSRVLLSIVRDITESKKSEFIRQIVYQINNTVFEASDYNDLLQRVHSVFKDYFKMENFFIATYNKGSETISIPYIVDKNDSFENIPIEKTFTGHVIRKGEAVLLREKDSLKMIEEGEVDLIGKLAKVWMGVPIIVRDELTGVMVMQDYDDENAFSENELEIMKFVSDQVGLVIDRILSRQALVESENELRETNQTKDKFFSILAHDLRNPFVTILGFSDILQEDYKDMDDDERLNLITEMRMTAQNTYGLLENLLNWSRSEIGTLKIKPKLFSVSQIVENIYSVVDANARMKKIELDADIETGIKVFADKSTIETVLRNLVTNSIKFTNEGGFVRVSALDKDTFIEITVKDNGIGISKDQLDKLFNLQENTSKRGTANEAGSGLGLILCKEFVQRNNGKLWVESEEGKGSEFKFTLPKM